MRSWTRFTVRFQAWLAAGGAVDGPTSRLELPGRYEGLEAAIVSLFHFRREAATGQLPVGEVAGQAIATDTSLLTRRV